MAALPLLLERDHWEELGYQYVRISFFFFFDGVVNLHPECKFFHTPNKIRGSIFQCRTTQNCLEPG